MEVAVRRFSPSGAEKHRWGLCFTAGRKELKGLPEGRRRPEHDPGVLRMLLHEGLLGTVLLLGQGLVLVFEQPRQKNLLEQAELLGVRVGRRRRLGEVVGVVVVRPGQHLQLGKGLVLP